MNIKQKILLALLLSSLCLPSRANMASPISEGSFSSSPFISQFVDITHENIFIIPDAKFETAQFIIEYHIHAGKSGKQIPLLFYAFDYRGDFRVWLDGQEIQLSQVSETYEALEGTSFADFDSIFETRPTSQTQYVDIQESPSRSFSVAVDDLKFFEADLTAGSHTIRVEYLAQYWEDRSDWVAESSFRYALSPAKYWKSFGSLKITLDASNFDGKLTTTLGEPTSGDLSSKATWKFSSLPIEVLQISYVPEISTTAKTLIDISPEGLMGIFAAFMVLIHFFAMKAFRTRYPDKRFSWVMILGSTLVPFIVLLAYIYSFDIIDAAIGEHASSSHGYFTFFVYFFYPFVLAVYWPAMWLVDRFILKRKT